MPNPQTDKVTWSQLRQAIAKRIGTNEKEVNLFLTAFIAQITNALRADRLVRINGLGTFKLQEVAPRRSINIATGEPITIPGYDKVIFLPEASVRELINHQPVPEQVRADIEEIIDPIQKLGAQAVEIVDILAELGQDPRKPQPTPTWDAGGSPADRHEEATPEDAAFSSQAQPAPTDCHEEATPEPTPEPDPTPAPKPAQPGPAPIRRPWLTAGITILCFTLCLAGAFLFVGHKFVQWVDTLHERANTPLPVVEQTIDQPTLETPQDTTATWDAGSSSRSQTAPAERSPERPSDPEPTESLSPAQPDYSDILAVEELHADSRLAWLAYKYYGAKDLWVFIYEANRDVLPNPHQIKVGTPIRIPNLSPELRDLTNPDTQRLIEEKKALYAR